MARIIENSGETAEHALLILDARSTKEGVAAEYAYLETRYGKREIDWRLKVQSLHRINGRHYDVLTIETASGHIHAVYFDITDFFGKA